MTESKHKMNTSAEYIRRINKAFVFIHQNLDKTIRLDNVAGASCFSPYHFHRIFHALVGETVNDYVSRKRMEKAASRLVYKPEMSVTDVAEVGGFSSSANFSKAFKLYFGISPTDLRNGHADTKNYSKIGKLFSKYGKAFNPQDLYSQFVTQEFVFDPDKLEEMLMKVKIEDQPEKIVVYLTTPNGYEMDSIFATWDKIIHWASTQGIEENKQERFAICYDNPTMTPEAKCRYEAAVVVDPEMEVALPYSRSVIPGGKYAIAYYKDDAEKINNFVTELCSRWFPDSGYEPDDYPIRFNYLNDSRQDGYVEMDVYIKLRELSVG